MENNKNIPKLRFPEFKGQWVKEKLSSLCDINPNTGNLPNIFIYIDLESVSNGELIKENTISKNNAPSRAQRVLEKGDILFQTVRPYQKNNYFFKKDGDYVASTGYAQIRTGQNRGFIYQYLYFQKFVNKILSRCTGTSYPAINSTDLSNTFINFPNPNKEGLNEQQKIASFLTAIDRQIDLLQQKKEALANYKKGVMQKIFSQEIRFKDKNGNDFKDWEEKKLGEVSNKMKSGGTPRSTNKKYYDGKIPFLAISDMTSQGKYLRETSKNISKEGLDNSSSFITNPDSLIYSMYASVGFVSIVKRPIAISQAVMNIELKDNYNLEYVYYFLHFFKPKIRRFVETGTQGNINATITKSLKIPIPEYKEQQKIAQFLSALDASIKGIEQKIEATKIYKKGLLQKMFV